MSFKTVASLINLFLEVGGFRITGFAEDAIKIQLPEWLITSKKGLDNVAWLAQLDSAQELVATVTLSGDSPSVKVLKGYEKAKLVIPFRFEWDDIGVFIEALDCIVQEVGSLDVGTEMPDVVFEIKIKNFIEMKGL
ncbi:MAG: hypothetical protein COB61_005755 [Thiotrichales bacterium]|nr:hypothetical protein [Thiotrichales bacterium]